MNYQDKIMKIHCIRMNLYRIGKTDEEIAKLTGASKDAIRMWRYKNKLPIILKDKKEHRIFINQRRKKLCEKYSDNEIAELEGITLDSVKSWRERNKIFRKNEKLREPVPSYDSRISRRIMPEVMKAFFRDLLNIVDRKVLNGKKIDVGGFMTEWINIYTKAVINEGDELL